MNLTYAVRALTVFSTVFTWAMGWGAVWVLKKRAERPLERFTPAPAWVNGLFMLGLTMIHHRDHLDQRHPALGAGRPGRRNSSPPQEL